jgi:hypothetical protein
MKKVINLILLLVLLNSCSTIDSVDRLVSKANPKYNLKVDGNASYLAHIQVLSNFKKNEITQYIKNNFIINDSITDSQLGKLTKSLKTNKIGNIKHLSDLIEKDSVIFGFRPSDGSGYAENVLSNSRKAELIKYIMSLNNEDTLYSESRFKSFLIVLIDNGLIDHNSLNTLVKDSAIVIKVSFDKTRSNENLKLESIYYWDYSNFRFLVPFLPLFNEYHKRNQCVNKAIESCIKNNMDAVVICPSLNHFKLYKNPLTYP